MTTKIIILIIALYAVGFLFGIFAGAYYGVRRAWKIFERAIDSSDLTKWQKLNLVKKIREINNASDKK